MCVSIYLHIIYFLENTVCWMKIKAVSLALCVVMSPVKSIVVSGCVAAVAASSNTVWKTTAMININASMEIGV